ncbi:hypothetical protein BO78DRAFT_186810 [Aspergillus sclerotiicarbonarius CBS 121057]|uniref:Uncharacterized protein n=1 Tax=Aspergillus sclerotiicarbonarius (strain CBS 121057 / IBT 28362) TaxID=1448318 RepID=A0A319ESL6_ASPSB|nr:hypothetical protein BO78DRAFT_186810 [Aspergillus sclerotiicarbonarius CBS 121057]
MKLFSLTALSSLVAATVSAAPFPSAYTLVADGGWTVVTDGTNAYIGTGDIANYPILILKGGDDNSMITGTEQHKSSAGVQHLYVMQDGNTPVALTDPNAGGPAGAVLTGFGIDDQNYLTVDGQNSFGVDPSEGQIRKIYHLDGSGDQYQQISLWVKECKGC